MKNKPLGQHWMLLGGLSRSSKRAKQHQEAAWQLRIEAASPYCQTETSELPLCIWMPIPAHHLNQKCCAVKRVCLSLFSFILFLKP